MDDFDPVEHFERAARAVERVIGAIDPEQMDNPTPCTEWNVRQLLNHLVGGNESYVARLASTEPFDPDSFDRTRDFLGDDPAAAFHRSVDGLRELFTAP